jgi:hypothetical protein
VLSEAQACKTAQKILNDLVIAPSICLTQTRIRSSRKDNAGTTSCPAKFFGLFSAFAALERIILMRVCEGSKAHALIRNETCGGI